MSGNVVLTFTLLFGAVIALICAVYVYLINRRRIEQLNQSEDNTDN